MIDDTFPPSYLGDIYTEAPSSDDTLANLGPLAPFAGVWEGAGGVDTHPQVDGPQTQPYVERWTFELPIDAADQRPAVVLRAALPHAHHKPRGRSRPSTTKSATCSGSRRPAAILMTLAIPRGQVAMAGGFVATGHADVHAPGGRRRPALRHRHEPVPRRRLPHDRVGDHLRVARDDAWPIHRPRRCRCTGTISRSRTRTPTDSCAWAPRRPTRSPLPAPPSETQWLDRRRDQRRVAAPVDAGNVDVELDLVAVRIGDVEAVRHGVVAGAHDRDVVLLKRTHGRAQVVVAVWPIFSPKWYRPTRGGGGAAPPRRAPPR